MKAWKTLNRLTMIKRFFWIALLCSSCVKVDDTISPRLSLQVDKDHIKNLASAFEPLSQEEKQKDWAKEYNIGMRFAQNFDLYRAISTFKRSEVLAENDSSRILELSYLMIYCYYLGERYYDAVKTFESSDLMNVDLSFSPHHDLLLVLLKSYMEIGDAEKSTKIQNPLEKNYPKTHKDVKISLALQSGDLATLNAFSHEYPYLESLTEHYHLNKKSPMKAQVFNAILPGMGYWYLGLHKSAFSSLIFNSLFIYTSFHFFREGNIAAGILSSCFEFGWYVGSIYGAGESAKYYNERIYEKYASGIAEQHKHTPTFMLRYGF